MTEAAPRRRAGRAATVAFVLAATALAAADGQPGDRARAEALAKRAAAQMQALQHEADSLASQERSVLGDLRRLEVERELRTQQERQARADMEVLAARIDATGNRMAALEQQEAAARPALDTRLVALYKLGRGGYAQLLLSTPDLRNLGRAYRVVSAMSAIDQRAMADAQASLDRLRDLRATLETQRVQMASLDAAATRAQQAAQEAADQRSALLDQIDRRRDLNARLVGELQAAQQKLQSTLATLSTSAHGSGRVDVPVLPIEPFRGALDWPVDGRVAAAFHQGSAAPGFARDGIEIAAPEGEPVRAVHGGTVAFAGPFTGFGHLVIVGHGNRAYSLYGNLGALSVARGDRVDAGQEIGRLGVPPAGAPELYFELQIDGQAVDPLQWLKARP
jgi:murein hydrolase activator